MNYRPFTDRPEEEADALREEMKAQEEDEAREEALAKLGKGFKAFLPGKKTSEEGTSSAADDATEAKEGVCTYRGKKKKERAVQVTEM